MSSALSIPAHLTDKAAALPESSYGATRVTLFLTDGRRISDVFLAWGTDIAKIGQRLITSSDELDFRLTDIEDLQ